ncbi:hypothetical protein DMC30DRAFT_406782 [Rhodotorula diobovata]|uniref:Zn(2)-C6 fungal-type domain-containing protein n=1 Tax=Rhodotorula diobovata TaxID=5288 RepID=A0A5C5FLN7_9BASI|nr:hypothetical protein DMC30DRAFT_406782 [Rhodotorula diobovata]
MSEPTKRKKPPSCDHCKAKRVLCHPSPQGCPRCLEKRIPCTTTPVVRRKPTRKTQHTDGRSHESSVEATAAGSSSGAASTPVPVAQQAATPAAPPTFPHLLSANPGASAPQLAAVSSAGAAPLPPAAPFAVPLYNPMGGSSASPMPTSDPTVLPSTLVASTSQVPYTANPAQASTAALASNAPSLRRPDLVQPSPAFARHLFDCFRNTSLYDHPISRGSRLQELLEPVGYRLELLDPQARTMAYASFALGALMSFDPAIIGTDGPGASSFNEMELVCGQLGDLRQFGRRRVSACGVMREHALKMAKDTDVLLEPTRNNAASALILDFLTNLSDARSPNRPWLAAFMGHVRVLCDTGELNIVDGAQTVWGLHLGSDMFTELSSGRLTATAADQLALVGDLDVDLDAFEKKLRSWLPVPQLHDVFRETLHPFALAQLAISRELADNILAGACLFHSRSRSVPG